jgi:Flp pilus assembly protein TadG
VVEHIRERISTSKASKGQIIILAALFAVVLTGMVGLSIDVGYAFAEKRATQNAADAAALAGAHAVTEWSLTNAFQAADSDVATVVADNKMNSSTTLTYTCTYVDDSGQNQGACSAIVPATATGVHIVVHETHSTFFIRAVPFAPKTVSTSASATAHVQGVTTGIGGDSPFIVCGINTELDSGGKISILLPVAGTSTYTINPLAYGKTFDLHSPHVADCGNQAEDWKGLSDPDSDFSKAIPGWFDSLNGDKAGPTRVRVNGINGCAAGTTDPNGCVLIVPIASKAVNGEFYVETIGAFYVTQSHANAHVGVLLKDYDIQVIGSGGWTGSNGWKVGDDGLIEVRLTS